MKYRSVDTISAEHLGRRVTVRRRLSDGALGDVVGVLENVDAASVTVQDRHGERIEIHRSDIVAARVIEAPSLENPRDPAPG